MTQKQDKPDKLEQARVLSEKARRMVPAFERYIRNEGNTHENSLAYYSLTGGSSDRSGIQGLVAELRKGSVEQRAQELLDVLHNQHGINAEFAANLLVAVATDLAADRLRLEHNMDRYTELAQAIRNLNARELDETKLAVLCEVMVRIAATPAVYLDSPTTPEIKLSDKKTAELKKMLMDIGISEEDTHEVIWNSQRLFGGDTKHRLSGVMQHFIDWAVSRTAKFGNIEFNAENVFEGTKTKALKKIQVTREDLSYIGMTTCIKPEKEEEIVTEMLLYLLKDPSKTTLDADFMILISQAKEYAHRFNFYKPLPAIPHTQTVVMSVPIEEKPDVTEMIENLVCMMESKRTQILEAMKKLPEDHPMRRFLSSTLGYADAIRQEAQEIFGRSKSVVSTGVHAQFEANLPEDGLIRLNNLDTSPEPDPSSERYVKLVARISEYVTERRTWYCHKEQGSGSLAAGCMPQDVFGESTAAGYAADVEESRQRTNRIRYVVMPKRLSELQAAAEANLNHASLSLLFEKVRDVELMQ